MNYLLAGIGGGVIGIPILAQMTTDIPFAELLDYGLVGLLAIFALGVAGIVWREWRKAEARERALLIGIANGDYSEYNALRRQHAEQTGQEQPLTPMES